MEIQNQLGTIAEDKEITGLTLRVLMILLSDLNFESYAPIKQKEIMQRLEIHQPNVSKSIKQLVKKEILLKMKNGTTTVYKLNFKL
jgi:DNA-binding MarR family transcriptional regulator